MTTETTTAPERPAPRHVALVGPLGAGKTSLAKELERTHGFRRIAFADALKDEIVELVNDKFQDTEFTFDRQLLEAQKYRYRPLLQTWGELRRELSDGRHWIDVTLERVEEEYGYPYTPYGYLPDDPDFRPFVIDDLRYANEADVLRAAGFLIVRIRPDEDRHREMLLRQYSQDRLDEISRHPSEVQAAQIEADYEVYNDFPVMDSHINLMVWSQVISCLIAAQSFDVDAAEEEANDIFFRQDLAAEDARNEPWPDDLPMDCEGGNCVACDEEREAMGYDDDDDEEDYEHLVWEDR